MNILIVGRGCREYAIGEKIKSQRSDANLYFAPGNGGTTMLGENTNIPETEIASLIKFCETNKIDLTIVGPEAPLVVGIVDAFNRAGLRIFGVNKKSAMIEGSKDFMKGVLDKCNIPTARYNSFSDCELAIAYAKKLRDENAMNRVVLKADGLASGKGVLIVSSDTEIENGVKNVLSEKIFGDQKLLIEEYLIGFESSLIGFFDGKTIKLFPPCRDHKTIYEGNIGPNTGGMGTYCPDFEAEVYREEIDEKIVKPFIEACKKSDLDYRGIVFFGLMIGSDGPKVLEINVRFGDPETQALMMLLESDLVDIMEATIDQKLEGLEIIFTDKKCVNVCISSGGYPASYKKGYEIEGLLNVKDSKIFYGGVKEEDGHMLTDGGRVISVANVSDSFKDASERVYSDIKKINFQDMYYRGDISPHVMRVYVWKKDAYDVNSKAYTDELRDKDISFTNLKYYKRYDIEGLTYDEIEIIKDTILREPPVDEIAIGVCALNLQKNFKKAFVRRYKKGQFDQRVKGLLDTIKAILPESEVLANCEEVFTFEKIEDDDFKRAKNILINPVDQEEGNLIALPKSIDIKSPQNKTVYIYEGFKDFNDDEIERFHEDMGFAMDKMDLLVVRDYFKREDRDPTDVELSVLDTYWSDHCRHTTFLTELVDIKLPNSSVRDRKIEKTFGDYMRIKEEAGDKKPISLMNLGTIHAKYMRKKGQLDDVEISDEINACTLIIDAHVDGKDEEYLLFFKNETHNHPTEIEPFGGAQTCLGGAIRDPLSGRGYVYQAMRLTGASDPLNDMDIEGKLPQKKIINDALRGYSSYGNQIGLATGMVEEVFHDGFKAKRMEVGAVIGAAPRKYVKRLNPSEGDIVILLGGKTGRDGVGGATGSSKSHTVTSIEEAGAEVQKGHAPTERKIQRLFRRSEVSSMIKKCNDFGAGGVSVAIGELADSLDIYLDRVPLKYSGLTPREIAISESQERMAVVIDKEDREEFLKYAKEENLEATHVADVKNHGYMRMFYGDDIVLDMSREFLNSTGASRIQNVEVTSNNSIPYLEENIELSSIDAIKSMLSDIDHASRKNMLENFDFSVGRSTVTMPLGGKNELTPIMSMVAKLPSMSDDTDTVSFMSYGYIPRLSYEDPFVGSYYAVMSSVLKAVSSGAPLDTIRLSYQEYFQKLGKDEKIWGKPFQALLGALKASLITKTPPIGGKDSMSGSFEDIHVPPTLISFAVGYGDKKNVTTSELKGGFKLGYIVPEFDEDNLPTDASMLKMLLNIEKGIREKNIASAYVLDRDPVSLALLKMSFGNDIGFKVDIPEDIKSKRMPLMVVVEYKEDRDYITHIGESCKDIYQLNGTILPYHELKKSFEHGMDEVYGARVNEDAKDVYFNNNRKRRLKSKKPVEEVNVLIPVFEGTNSEYDSALAFRKEGANVREVLIRNLTKEMLQESLEEFSNLIRESQILFIPGGFSMGDEPDGSAKFIANVLRNEKIKESIEYLLDENGQDGLILGICNGFQALIKTGLLPYGNIKDMEEDDPTLSFNTIGRHIARIVPTKAITLDSPWLKYIKRGFNYNVPISHGEGRFVANDEVVKELQDNNQIAFKYLENPNGSSADIEAIIDKSGKILGKMGHSERVSDDTYINYPDIEIQNIFKAGVDFFKK